MYEKECIKIVCIFCIIPKNFETNEINFPLIICLILFAQLSGLFEKLWSEIFWNTLKYD